MLLNEYQYASQLTNIVAEDRKMDYAITNLAGEVGELASHWAKAIRDDEGVLSPERRRAMEFELGDCLWQLAAVADGLDTSLGFVAELNLQKLQSRKERDVLKGTGDYR